MADSETRSTIGCKGRADDLYDLAGTGPIVGLMPRHREEVVNVRLADLLGARGVHAQAETVVGTAKRQLPDVRLEWHGVAIAIECKFDRPGARSAVEEQAERRLETNLASIAIALLYPDSLSDSDNLAEDLERSRLAVRFAAIGGRVGEWLELEGVDGLARSLDVARALLVSDRSIDESAALLDGAIENFRWAVAEQAAREGDLLRIVAAADAVTPGSGTREERKAAVSIAGLSLCTAAMLHLEISKYDPHVPALPAAEGSGIRSKWARSWRQVLDHDYAAVFRIARDVLEALTDDPGLEQALRSIDRTARTVASRKILGRHDLVGRLYHRLLADQKFLATYYTRVPSATLLNGVALNAGRWPDVDWAAESEDFDFRCGDLACGTGTLLVSAASDLSQTWAFARGQADKEINLNQFARKLLEENFFGYDILAYAVQVCATTPLLAAPGSPISSSHLFQMPFGGEGGQLGSLELLYGETSARLFGDEPRRRIGSDEPIRDPLTVGIPRLDYVVMNPPFTRSVNSNRLLGSLPAAELRVARSRLSQLMRGAEVEGSLTAGLAAPFVALGARAVKPGGRLALVLPKTFLTGLAWAGTRQLLATKFHVEDVIVSHEPGRWNFSDSTDLSEAMIVARRLSGDDEGGHFRTRWIQLRRNVLSPVDALSVVSALHRLEQPSEAGEPIRISEGLEGEVGEVFSRPSPRGDESWPHASFSTSALDQVAHSISTLQSVTFPGGGQYNLRLCALGDLATFGYDTRDIHDAFERSEAAHGFAGFWGHNAQRVRSVAQTPNTELRARTEPAPGRARIKDASAIWATASTLLLADRLWLITQRCASVLLDRPAVGPTWWELTLKTDDVRHRKALVLWFNSTIGLVSLLFSTEEARGPWIKLKKNKLPDIAVLDVRRLPTAKLERLACAFEELRDAELLPVAMLDRDPTRVKIDRAISDALALDPTALEPLRRMLSREPRVQPVPRAPGRTEGLEPIVPELALF